MVSRSSSKKRLSFGLLPIFSPVPRPALPSPQDGISTGLQADPEASMGEGFGKGVRSHKRITVTFTNGEPSNTSCSPISYGHFFSFYDYRDLPRSTRILKHLFKFTTLLFYIHILGILTVGRPGPTCIGSTRFAINNNFFCHNQFLLSYIGL